MAQAFSPEYKILTDFQSVIALQDEWEDLCRRSTRHYLAQSFTWFRASWETTAAPRGDRLYCLVIRVAGKIRLIWPFVIFRAGGVKVARPLPQATEYCTVLVEDGPDAERYVAAAGLATIPP
jgi:CelD/BcsL family acetyltransferase involved in cellulose biosynthesis